MGGAASGDHVVREAQPGDDLAIVALLSQTSGWVEDDRHRELFDWKHRQNPFGSSPGWVAHDDEGLIGSRTLMRWRFVLGDESITAVRAVDTATHPRAQGRGIFRELTLRGVRQMTAEGVDWVFNTPNAISSPGYVSMGWRRMGHLRVSLRPSGVQALSRVLRARQPAELWSVPTSAGESARSVLDDSAGFAGLLGGQPRRLNLHTDIDPAYLTWRYGACPVGYRAVLGGSKVSDGVAFFRLRHRGPALEGVVGDILSPGGDKRVATRLRQRVLDVSGADYVVAIGTQRPKGWLRVPGDGPLLTWRPLARKASVPIERWDSCTGDVELF